MTDTERLDAIEKHGWDVICDGATAFQVGVAGRVGRTLREAIDNTVADTTQAGVAQWQST